MCVLNELTLPENERKCDDAEDWRTEQPPRTIFSNYIIPYFRSINSLMFVCLRLILFFAFIFYIIFGIFHLRTKHEAKIIQRKKHIEMRCTELTTSFGMNIYSLSTQQQEQQQQQRMNRSTIII